MANVIKGNGRLWPNARIPYEILNSSFPAGSDERAEIEWAIDHWNSRSRLKFTPHDPASSDNWVRFRSHDSACSSHVGRQNIAGPPNGGPPPPQEIRCFLGSGGFRRGNILHEMGHAAGLFHEHQRPDRDDFVDVDSSDATNYGKKSASEVVELTPYDYLSIMHYGETSSLTNLGNLAIGQRDRLSYLDLYALERRHETGGGDHWVLSTLHML